MFKSDAFRKLAEIFSMFFKIGLFTFGGGYAMIPLIEKEIVEKKKWLGSGELTDILAVSQSIPGAIAINSATFIGYRISGKKGAVSATLGVVLPSFVIIALIAAFMSKIGSSRFVEAAFAGIRPAVVSLIAVAAFKVGKASVKDWLGAAVAAAAALLVAVFNIHAVLVIIAGAFLGLLLYFLRPDKMKDIIEKGDD